MLRSSFTLQAVRRYATAPATKSETAKNSPDVFLQNLLDKVKTIKNQPVNNGKSTFIKKAGVEGNYIKRNNRNDNGNQNNRGANNRNSNNNNRNKNGQNRKEGGIQARSQNNGSERQRYQRSKFADTSMSNQAQFSPEEFAKQRRARNEARYGSGAQADVFDSTRNGFKNRKARPNQQKSIFATKTGTRSSPMRRNRNRAFNESKGQTPERKVVEEIYSPQEPALPDLIKYSSHLAFNQESRLSRAIFQVLQHHYQVPDLYSDKADLLDHGKHVIIQQPLSSYPYNDKLPISTTKVMGPTIVNVDFDYNLLNTTIERTVFGKFADLKIDVTDDKLKLNAQVVQNSLNRNVFYNYNGRKERIYKSCTGLDTVKSLTQ